MSSYIYSPNVILLIGVGLINSNVVLCQSQPLAKQKNLRVQKQQEQHRELQSQSYPTYWPTYAPTPNPPTIVIPSVSDPREISYRLDMFMFRFLMNLNVLRCTLGILNSFPK